MKSKILCLLWLASHTTAQSSSQSPQVITLTGSQRTLTGDYLPGVTLSSIIEGSSIVTIPQSSQPSQFSSISRASNGTISSTPTSTPVPVTNIGGANRTTSVTATRTRSAVPSNTQPCNNYVELCNRKYSNITQVAAHNSPFYRQNNVARNQDYPVTSQLNDGIRTLVTQAHWVNDTLYMCHTSCDLLNAGTVEDYLKEVLTWVEQHPFDVVTIIFGNYDWSEKNAEGKPLVTSVQYDKVIRSSGLINYIYQPPKNAMAISDWPTLGQMILSQKRVVTFIDYNFDTIAVPYMLWEFYNVWETPFSPTNFDFPCTLGRPEGISEQQQKNMLYLANHNLNTEIKFGSFEILVPNVAQIKETNAVSGNGSLGLMTSQCTGTFYPPYLYPIPLPHLPPSIPLLNK